MKKHLDRQKVNFMISKELLAQFYQLVPSGERSDCINEALDEYLTNYGRRKAIEGMRRLSEQNLSISTKEFLKQRHEGLL